MKKIFVLMALGLLACSSSDSTNTTSMPKSSSDCSSCIQDQCSKEYNTCNDSSDCIGAVNTYCDCMCEQADDEVCSHKVDEKYGEDSPAVIHTSALGECIDNKCASVCNTVNAICGCDANNNNNNDKDAYAGTDTNGYNDLNGNPVDDCVNCTNTKCKDETARCQKDASDCAAMSTCMQTKCATECHIQM